MPNFAYTLLLGLFIPVLFIIMKGRKDGLLPTLTNKGDVGIVLLLAYAGGNLFPPFILVYHDFIGGLEACLPEYFGQTLRISLLAGALGNAWFSLSTIISTFAEMLNTNSDVP